MITIDGAQYSGSGTILRYALALATLLREPLTVKNIRARRPKPGLRPQHLAATLACARISHGRVEGAEVGSTEIRYEPGATVLPGEYPFDVGSAGSTTLLAFSLCIPAMFADRPTKFLLTGGLFQDFAPSSFHMRRCLLPLLERMGLKILMTVIRPGYAPRGQGQVEVTVHPIRSALKPLTLVEQGRVTEVRGISLASHLIDQKVSARMAAACRSTLERRGLSVTIETLDDFTAVQKGAALCIWAESDTGAVLGSDMAGATRRPSEKIARSVAIRFLEDIDSGATVDRHLADQLIIFGALARGATTYTIPHVTEHVESNLWLVGEILGARAEIARNVLTIHGVGLEPFALP
ncbi:MAG: RNA 3'-phosphate cyclase [Deltaproteobacteria bacterium]|nr:RNA 3'-phosphate cyclase [Deltaproteobacteria bacterium]